MFLEILAYIDDVHYNQQHFILDEIQYLRITVGIY